MLVVLAGPITKTHVYQLVRLISVAIVRMVIGRVVACGCVKHGDVIVI